MSTENEACLEWLAGALQRLCPEERTRIVGYLEAVLEEIMFEIKAAPWA